MTKKTMVITEDTTIIEIFNYFTPTPSGEQPVTAEPTPTAPVPGADVPPILAKLVDIGPALGSVSPVMVDLAKLEEAEALAGFSDSSPVGAGVDAYVGSKVAGDGAVPNESAGAPVLHPVDVAPVVDPGLAGIHD